MNMGSYKLISRRRLLAAAAITLGAAGTLSAKNWEDWGSAVNLEALPGSSAAINTPAVDGCASLSPDGLTIVFNSNRSGNFELYMARRSSTSEGFGAPQVLPAPVNGPSNEACATIATGNRLYFSSDRDDPAYDIYVSKLRPSGWSVPVNLGPNINEAGALDEAAAFYQEKDGTEVMLFSRRPNSGAGDGKIYQSVNGAPASLVAGGPHSSAGDNRPSVTRDGLTIFFDSTRTGTLGGPDLYYATRSSTSQPFGSAVHLSNLSSPAFDARPFISKDGTLLTFSSGRTGSESPAPDIWIAGRGKVTGK